MQAVKWTWYRYRTSSPVPVRVTATLALQSIRYQYNYTQSIHIIIIIQTRIITDYSLDMSYIFCLACFVFIAAGNGARASGDATGTGQYTITLHYIVDDTKPSRTSDRSASAGQSRPYVPQYTVLYRQ